eukprot:g4604.t1
MGQALQTPVHEALRPLQAVPVSAVDSFAVQVFKDMDMEFGLRFEDVEAITEKFAEVDPHALYELFHDESIVEDGDVPALDVLTAMVLCAKGSPMNIARVLYRLFDFDGAGAVRGDQLSILVVVVFRCICIALGGDNLAEPTEDKVRDSFERSWMVYEDDAVGVAKFRKIITSMLAATMDENTAREMVEFNARMEGNDASTDPDKLQADILKLCYKDVCSNLYSSFDLTFDTPLPGIEDPAVVAARIAAEEAERARLEAEREQALIAAAEEAERRRIEKEHEERRQKEAEEAARKAALRAEAEAAREAKRKLMRYMLKVDRIRVDQPGNLVAKYFTNEIFDLFQSPEDQARIMRCVKPGIEVDPSLPLGCFALRAEDYEDFSIFFDRIVCELNDASPEAIHEGPMWGDLDTLDANIQDGDIDYEKVEVTLRVEVDRNLKGFNFPSALDQAERVKIEEIMIDAFSKAGLVDMGAEMYSMTPDTVLSVKTEEEIAVHKAKGVLYDHEGTSSRGHRSHGTSPVALKIGDFFEHWPHGRGSYVSSDGVVIVQIGGENHIRVICETNSSRKASLQDKTDGKKTGDIFRRLKATLDALETAIPEDKGGGFARSDRYGYLTSSPSMLGTAMKCSACIRKVKETVNGEGEIIEQNLEVEDVLDTSIGLGVRQALHDIRKEGVISEEATASENGIMVELWSSSGLFTTEESTISNMCEAVQSVAIAMSQADDQESYNMEADFEKGDLEEDKAAIEDGRKPEDGEEQAEETDAAETGSVEADATEADATEADAAEIDAAETDAAETGSVEADAAETDAAETGSVEADATEADAAEIDAAETDAAETGSVEADAAEADAAETDAAETGSVEADAAEADAAEIDAAETDAAETDAAETDAVEGDTLNPGDQETDSSTADKINDKDSTDGPESMVTKSYEEIKNDEASSQGKVPDQPSVNDDENKQSLEDSSESKNTTEVQPKGNQIISKKNKKYVRVYNGLIQKVGVDGKLSVEACKGYLNHMCNKEKPIHGIRYRPDDILTRIHFQDESHVSKEEFILCLLEINKEKSIIKDAAKSFEKIMGPDSETDTVSIAALIEDSGNGQTVDEGTRAKLSKYLSQYDKDKKGALTFSEFFEMNRAERMKHKVGHGIDASSVDLSKDVVFRPNY